MKNGPPKTVSSEIERLAVKYGRATSTISNWVFNTSRTYDDCRRREAVDQERLEAILEFEVFKDAQIARQTKAQPTAAE